MSSEEIVALAGDADGQVKIGDCDVWYYSRRFISDEEMGEDYLARVESTQDLPWVYGNFQLLFDTAGTLQAYTCNGEELNVHTTRGSFSGDHFKELPTDFLEQICFPQISDGDK